MLTSWPALSTSFDDDWIIRLADGMTKRSNSVTCLGSDASELDQRIDRVEGIFEQRGLPPVFRVSPLASPALTKALDRRGWRRFDESIVMTLDLVANPAEGNQGGSGEKTDIDIACHPDDAWLDGCRRIDGLSDEDARTLPLILERLMPKAGYGRITADKDSAALALAVLDVELVGLFLVMTAEDQRRKGFSRRLLSHLLHAGRQHGGTTGWLAVASYNEPAVALYQSLGFSEVYRYHYRSKA